VETSPLPRHTENFLYAWGERVLPTETPQHFRQVGEPPFDSTVV